MQADRGMTTYWLNVAFLRVILPLILAGCIIWRPVGLSIIYLGMLLYSPMVPIPTKKTMAGHTGFYLKASIGLAFLVAITQLTFHIVLLSLPPYGHFLRNCEFLEKLFRHIGLVRLDSASVWEVFFWLTPEFIVLPTLLAVYFICRFLTQSAATDEEDNTSAPPENASSVKKAADSKTRIINFLGHIGTYVALASLCITASLRPSVEGGFYFAVFLGASTWWACNKELRKGFVVLCRVVTVVVILHVLVLLSYQNQYPQELIPINSTWARYFGLAAVYETDCNNTRYVYYTEEASWVNYGYPLKLFCLYYVLVLQSQFLNKKPRPVDNPKPQPIDERTPLMRFGSGRTGLLQDSTGSVIVQDGHQDDSIQMQSLSEGVPDDHPGIIEQIIMAVFSIFQLILNSSYLATNIIMMTWSIMYHSWTTFALLLWALILWLVPNKRSSMMKCSPFLVFYATLLLLGQYVYSMDLTEEELPTIVEGIKISEIGFSKPDQLKRWHLIVKCAFISMFWITMRQYTAERDQLRRTSALTDMAGPFYVSVSTATTAMNHEMPEIKSEFMKQVGAVLKDLLTKFWIAVVAITLFICGITGERMTVFRIIYMSLFLFFVIVFQISWNIWRRLMYPFWITVIAYSVVMLILVYTYQFHNFPEYWEYLYIDKDLQMDIGLELYETKDLFVRLLTPTFFVIITVIQMHYFHASFLEATNIHKLGSERMLRRPSLGQSSTLQMSLVSPGEVTLTEPAPPLISYSLKQLKQMSKLERLALCRSIVEHLYNFYNYTWLFFEIHMQKILFMSIVLLCTNDVCAINLIFIIAVVITINFKRPLKIVSINVMAVAIAILMVIKMLYQIKYIDHNNWNVNCTRPSDNTHLPFASNNTVYNIAEWFGMKKAEPGSLAELLKGYIGIVTVTTLNRIIIIRQWFHRQAEGEPLETPHVMFPSITRADADKGLRECCKFLFNYGFYKFGLEMCLLAIVTLIGTRLDFYSVLYGIWLLLLFALRRKLVSRIWPVFRIFAIVLLPVQYALVVAPPSWLCLEYPWGESQVTRRLQEWMYFPDPDFPPNPNKLICDFILLLMIVRQSLVFRIEHQCATSNQKFAGGHNDSVIHDIEKPKFVNPVKDYVSHIHSWLDVFKRATMMSLMWITLSIMFLAGTKRTNIFSLGYLTGAFIFLWQGNDFYLRPIRRILKWWNILIGYNVIVIFSKALLQGVGCVLIKQLEHSACWLVQLLGIACLKKFRSSAKDDVLGIVTCEVPREDIGMVWDGLCFAFLLLQKRLFKSYYFFHIVDETKAMSILASRGAELSEERHLNRIEIQESVEKAVLQKLKFKMDKIKANQRLFHGPSYKEPQTHHIDYLYPGTRPLYRHRAPKSNREAVRSGDYYMFDDLDDDDVTDLTPQAEVDRREEEKVKRRRMTLPEEADAKSMTSEEIEAREKEITATDLTKTPEGSEDGNEESKEGDDEVVREEEKVSLSTYFKFLLVMLNSTFTSMTKYLNRYSADYRYIRMVLAKEKSLLKAKPDFRMGMRLGISQMWQPIPLIQERLATNGSTEDQDDAGEGPSQSHTLQRSSIITEVSAVQAEEAMAELSEIDQPPIIQLAASVWFGILAHSSLLCYFMVFLHQIKNASVLSTPLPLMVFCWGSLTMPRPSKTFWVTLIAYTEIIVIVKCIFQLEFIPWNQSAAPSNPFFAPRIIGIERQPNYALWDLLLLLMVFFHRYMLKSMGQWTRPTKARKIIPVTPTMPPKTEHAERGDKEPKTQFWQQEETNHSGAPIEPNADASQYVVSVPATSDDASIPQNSNEQERNVSASPEQVQPTIPGLPLAVNRSMSKYSGSLKSFFARILSPNEKEKTNVYAYMFLCDFFNFILLIFGFSAFGTQQGDGGVTTYLQENRVPMPFLLMLLLQFALIVIDRALFLKKSIGGKLIFQYCLIVGVHLWMFFILPSVTERPFNDKVSPQIWYMMKCFYLLLAAYQLRQGYPTRILGNFLCKNYSIINYVLFKGFMLVPFLFELRAVMDWIWTDTSMTIMDWFKMEDIFASIYQIKCMRGVETDFPQPRGEKKKQLNKYLVGGGALLIIIGLIWFPLLLFALGGTVGISNLPYEVSMKIRIGSYEPIYFMSAENGSIVSYDKDQYKNFTNLYAVVYKERSAVTFLENYVNSDVAVVKLSKYSRKLWNISPPDKLRLKAEIESNNTMTVHVEWSVSRRTDAKDSSGTTIKRSEVLLPPYVDGVFSPTRRTLADMLTPNVTTVNSTIILPHAFPKFLKVTSRTTSLVVQLMTSQLPTVKDDPGTNSLYRNISLSLSSDTDQQWWSVQEVCDDILYTRLLQNVPLNSCDGIVMFLFNDKAFPEGLSFISGFGILGLYTTAVIVVSQMMRKIVSDMAPKIMFDDLPYVDRILRLCLDIYLVRESGDLCLEEDLFAKLIFLYRSPETLIRWTRPPEDRERTEDQNEDQDEDEPEEEEEPHARQRREVVRQD